MSDQVQESNQPSSQETAAPDGLNINDLSMLKNLIDIVTTRGAFKANEMSSVGILYDKLSNFLDSVSKQQSVTASEQGE
jgi:hypothetical protein